MELWFHIVVNGINKYVANKVCPWGHLHQDEQIQHVAHLLPRRCAVRLWNEKVERRASFVQEMIIAIKSASAIKVQINLRVLQCVSVR